MSNVADENLVFQPPADIKSSAHCRSLEEYKRLYKKSVEQPVEFWGEIAKDLYWKVAPSKDQFYSFNFDVNKGPINISWMRDGVTNVCFNVLDRNVYEKNLGGKVAFYWEGNDPEDCFKITYAELLKDVCKCANVLKSKGLKKGDRVAIYMPMVIELVVAMLACARIGVVHSIVFGGFSENSLKDRIIDAQTSVLITSDGAWRGDKLLHIKDVCDGAIDLCHKKNFEVKHCIVIKHASCGVQTDSCNGVDGPDDKVGKRPTNKLKIKWFKGRDSWWHEEMAAASDVCEPEWMSAEDPLFILYTSGSTGRPKGILHTQAGYLLYTALTFKYVFDYHPDDVFFCTADIGWITGHSYVCYGPLANGSTSVLFEGVPFFPDNSRYWRVCDKYKVTKFYTAPTAIRALMKFGDGWVKKCNRSSLKVLGTVGEPINPEAWLWYHKVVGDSRCAIVDTFWQTETGGHVITPLPGATPTKPGSATFPFFGVTPVILNEEGHEIEGEGEGHLAFKHPWPGMMRTIFGNQQQFESVYFRKFPGYYSCGDGVKRDKDGYLWITGRIDDMLNVSGHLISTAEVESVLVTHPAIIEAAVVARPHPVKGECLYCFVTLKNGEQFNQNLITSLRGLVRVKMAPFAQPDFIQEAPNLPKTRSGKIMRRILRLIAVGDHNLGDTSTLADESIIEELFKLRKE